MTELTASHVTPPQRDLILAIAGNSCAWRTRDGWQPKNLGCRRFKTLTGETLVARQLATIETGKGSPRLVLTACGEALADDLKQRKRT